MKKTSYIAFFLEVEALCLNIIGKRIWKTTALRKIIMALKDKAYHNENIHVIDNKYQPYIGETVEFIYNLNSEAEAIRIGYDLLKQSKCVAFVFTEAVIARALVKKSKLSKPNNSPKNSNELFCLLSGRENIQAELASTRPNNLSIAIKGYREWNNNTISYKVNESLAVITFIEVKHQKCLSVRYFIEKLCSLIVSIGASLQLIKMDENQGVIENCKRVHNEIRVEALVIKNTDFNAVVTFWNLSFEKLKSLNSIKSALSQIL
ncbi:hypothetical protein C1646_663807 [Rhizophagus diaphanus]|nr:hypothetical protein C1646_663807 [Rhizophagus diaphanus] [Rhizophagus sp. MUCL 43196]